MSGETAVAVEFACSGPAARGGRIATGIGARRRLRSGEVNGEKAGRTCDQRLADAIAVFERQGYLNSSVEQIVNEAGLAWGSFCTYFESKAHVYRELAVSRKQALRTMNDFISHARRWGRKPRALALNLLRLGHAVGPHVPPSTPGRLLRPWGSNELD